MIFKVIGTGSSGNGYVLIADSGETLIIEAGMHLGELEDILDHDFDNVVGCVISHRHGDHAGHVKSYMSSGIHCYMNEDTITEMNLSGRYCHQIESEKQLKLGNFKIKPLLVEHGVPCLAFLLDHPESGRTFFLTDSSYCKWRFSKIKINNWLVECNYDLDTLKANLDSGNLPFNVFEHVVTGHFSLVNCIDLLKANDLSETIKIVTLHLSSKNGSARLFRKEIGGATGKEVIVARAGLVIEIFGKQPF